MDIKANVDESNEAIIASLKRTWILLNELCKLFILAYYLFHVFTILNKYISLSSDCLDDVTGNESSTEHTVH